MHDELKEAFESGTTIRNKTPLYKLLSDNTQHLPSDYLPRQKLWHLYFNTTENPGCKICGKSIQWESAAKTADQKYRTYCSRKCQWSDPEIKDKKYQTELQRYGAGRPTVVDKTKVTNNIKYGSDYAIQQDEYKQKQSNTVLSKYGVLNITQYKPALKKRDQTNLSLFGVRSHAQQHLPDDVVMKLGDYDWMNTQHTINKKSVIEIAQELNINYEIVSRHLKFHDISIQHYPSSSSYENQIYDFLCTILDSIDIQRNNKSILNPKHIDFYIEKYNLAIEFNGIYWHSEQVNPDRRYHLDKTNKALAQNIELIQIYESEWILKQELVKSILRSKLKQTTNTIFARKCDIREVDKQQAKRFLDENHIQGNTYSSVNIALFYQNKMVELITFGTPRFSKKYQYELVRLCSLQNHSIVGGVSKIFKYFVKKYNPNSVISYNDKRWGTGAVYSNLGFKFSHASSPNYWYFKSGDLTLHSRVKFQKHKLQSILNVYDSSLTEWENMIVNGYNRIWDCGNNIWEWYP